MVKKSIDRWQFGDFQTPDVLAQKILKTLKYNHKLNPNIIIEPSCGKGAFIRAAINEFPDTKILGLDINKNYVKDTRKSISGYQNVTNAIIEEADFFLVDWKAILAKYMGYILVVGNPPWVTSSQLSILNSQNIPAKSNFQNRKGIDAITGRANFDISEWMLLQYIDWLSDREGTIAILCKYSVARKIVRQVKNKFFSSVYLINAKTYFGASVEACLFVLSTSLTNFDCQVYDELESKKPSSVIGKRNSWLLSKVGTYEKWQHLAGQNTQYLWRSGIKHDCSKVMELERVNSAVKNGIGEIYFLEEEYLYPLLKSSDIGNGRTTSYRKLAIVTQTSVGEDTTNIKNKAPKTWQYLIEHDNYLRKRKSSIYKNKPPYSIFGVGTYTFKNWKIAISSFYKKLSFQFIAPLSGKAVVFDDTVNFLSFDSENEARFIYKLVTSKPSLEFLDSMIFWDEKRPITIDILKRLSLKALSIELGVLEQYLYWTKTIRNTSSSQSKKSFANTPSMKLK